MKLNPDNRIAVQARAARYLAHKQFQQDQKKHRNMDRFFALVCGLSVCVIIHFLGAL